MKYKEKLEIKRFIELENYLSNALNSFVDINSFMKQASYVFKKKEDLDYLYLAFKMPLNEVNTLLSFYDSFSFFLNPDELIFVDDLINKFKVSKKDVLKRVSQVRKIHYFKNISIKKRKRIKNNCCNGKIIKF